MLYRFYKIYSDLDDNICYIGKTKRKLNERIRNHKSNYIYNGFCTSKKVFEKYGIDNCKIILLEEIDFETKYEADKKEREYIESFNNCVNIELPTQTKKESSKKWRENNKEKIKEYRETNKEYLKEHLKKYNSQPYYCQVCNKTINLQSKYNHNKSQTHLNNL